MPFAIAINVVLGTDRRHRAEGAGLPRLDRDDPRRRARRPFAGAATGLLSNLAWTFLLAGTPFGSPFAWPFAIVAAEIGLLAGVSNT